MFEKFYFNKYNCVYDILFKSTKQIKFVSLEEIRINFVKVFFSVEESRRLHVKT